MQTAFRVRGVVTSGSLGSTQAPVEVCAVACGVASGLAHGVSESVRKRHSGTRLLSQSWEKLAMYKSRWRGSVYLGHEQKTER